MRVCQVRDIRSLPDVVAQAPADEPSPHIERVCIDDLGEAGLGRSPYRRRFVLKGAMLFVLWNEPFHRPTQDIDFAAQGTAGPDAGFARHEATRIDTLVRKIRQAIDQLRELRMALISAAVTGKIDVREAAPR